MKAEEMSGSGPGSGNSPLMEDDFGQNRKDRSSDRQRQDFSGGFTGERFLKNPLPVPKRRPHVKMEFDLADEWDILEEEDHFDLEIDEDDDFDV